MTNYFDNLKNLSRNEVDARIDTMLDKMGKGRVIDNSLTSKCVCGWTETGEPNEVLVLLKNHKAKCELVSNAPSVKRERKKYVLTEEKKILGRKLGNQASKAVSDEKKAKRGRPTKITREVVVSQIKAMADELGRTPFYEEARKANAAPSDFTMERLWGRPGPWRRALEEAGLTPVERGRPKK